MKVRTLGLLTGLISLVAIALEFSTGQAAASDLDSATPKTGANTVGASPTDPLENSVVKIYSTVRYPDYYKPWTKETPISVSGTGVVIKGKRILTNAHVVRYASQVQVQANESGNLINATVESVAPGIDLAVLKLDDDSFFDSHPPLEWASGPSEIQDPVMVYGYPEGGDNLSITKGIISRVEFASYNFPVEGLRIQIDAAINPGNSGGPAIVNGKMIGIAFSRLVGDAQNIGYIIPCEEIDIFLQAIANGQDYSKPRMFDTCQALSNPALRSFLKLDKNVEGPIVSNPNSTNADYPLKKWDVITKIGDTPVDDQGMVKLDGDLHVDFEYLIQKIATNGLVPLTIVRDGKEMNIELPVLNNFPRVIPHLDGGYPSYFVYGPMVFSDATDEFMAGFMRETRGGLRIAEFAYANNPLVTRLGDKPAFDQEKLVVVCSPMFPDKLSRGYPNPFGYVVKSVNGTPVKNLKHLVQVLRDSKDEFIHFDFYGIDTPALVFPRAEMAADTDSILMDNDIRSQGSPDVMSVWNAASSQ